MSSSLRILLAEDQQVNARLMVAMLESAGHEVAIAPDGEAAAQMGARDVFDVILMDYQMPGMNGDEAARAIRSGPSPMRDTPIIALTSEDDGAVQRKCLQAGMNSYITKPVDLAELLKVIDRVLRKQGRKRSGR